MWNPEGSGLKLELSFTSAFCEAIDTPRSLAVHLLAQAGEWEQLINLRVNPDLYTDHLSFAYDYAVTELLRKSTYLPLGLDLEQRAVDAFYACEDHNRATNERLLGSPKPEWFDRYKKHVAIIMGPLGSNGSGIPESVKTAGRTALDEIESLCKHGPGAVVGVGGYGIVPSDKFDRRATSTKALLPFAKSLMGESWSDYRPTVHEVRGNRFFTVPKNATARRGACTEPGLNQWLQAGIGRFLKERLRTFGVDLSQQGNNQDMARRAYSDGLATLDMESSSDLLAYSVVLESCPIDWVELLCLSRSDETYVGDRWVELEKFCSMGNGYTFPLQSVIFLSVARTVVPHDQWSDVSVYGDDIIVPQRYAQTVCDCLEFLGFKINWKKSCLAGSFFESCGTDWFQGRNVRPFYLRQSDKSQVPYALQMANALRRWSSRVNGGYFCDARFRSLWEAVAKLAPHDFRRCRVPLRLGDTGLLTDEGDPLIVRKRPTDGFEGCLVRAVQTVPVKVDKRTYGVLLASLAGDDFSAFYDIDDFSLELFERGLLKKRLMRLSMDGSSLVGTSDVSDSFSKGREARRGLFGLSSPKWVLLLEWDPGFSWL